MPGTVKPCPFCGSSGAGIDTFYNGTGNPVMFRAQCPECMAATGWHDSGEEAAEKWNTRARGGGKPGEEGKPPGDRVINKDLFYFGGRFYARNPHTGYCSVKTGDGCKRVKKGLWLAAYEECAGASGKRQGNS